MIFESITNTTMTLETIMVSSIVSLILGIAIAWTYMYKNTYTKNFVVTLALLPVMIHVVIMMVNGNLGTSVAVLGTFSLIRFRSVAGTAKDIGSIFFAMVIGLATGIGYLSFAVFITILICIMMLALNTSSFGEQPSHQRDLKITIPESLNYEGVFDDVFMKYTDDIILTKIKTTNMGSLFELQYRIRLKDTQEVKPFIDDLRVRNGNLAIVCSLPSTEVGSL